MLLRPRRHLSEEDFQELLQRTRTLETLSIIPHEALQPTRRDWGEPTTPVEITLPSPGLSVESAIIALLN